MMRRTSGLLPVLAMVLAGCATCPSRAWHDAHAPLAETDVPASQRTRVVTFIIGSENILDALGLSRLEATLRDQGYTKIYRGGLGQVGAFSRDLRQLVNDDPDVRIVLVGHHLGARAATSLASQPEFASFVAALVLMDPLMVASTAEVKPQTEVVVVRSHGWSENHYLGQRTYELPGIGQFDLPTHPLTADALVSVVNGVANRIPWHQSILPYTPLDDPSNPTVPAAESRPTNLGPEWDFLLGPSPVQAPQQRPLPKFMPERTARANGG
jgi:pimeloyl-ACP methyl ester carboxylesterase